MSPTLFDCQTIPPQYNYYSNRKFNQARAFPRLGQTWRYSVTRPDLYHPSIPSLLSLNWPAKVIPIMNQNPPPTNHSESVGDGDPIPFLVARLDESSPPDSPLSSVDTDLNPSPHSPGEGNSLSYDAEFSRSSDADDDAVSDSEYTVTLTGKRRKACPSSTAVSVSVKARVLRNYGEKCWLCGMVGKHVAHVIAKSDRVLVSNPIPSDYSRSLALSNSPLLPR